MTAVGKHPNSQANLAKGRTAKRAHKRYSYDMLAKMLRFMRMSGQFTVTMLAKHAGVSWISANRWVQANHRMRNVYISGWERTLNYRMGGRIYSWGDMDDVPRPACMPPAERQRRTRAKKSKGVWRDLVSTNA
jgi:hypothetical protein